MLSVVESINSLRTVMLSCIDHPREELSAFESWGLFTRLNSLHMSLESIDERLGPLDDKLGDILHRVTFFFEEKKMLVMCLWRQCSDGRWRR